EPEAAAVVIAGHDDRGYPAAERLLDARMQRGVFVRRRRRLDRSVVEDIPGHRDEVEAGSSTLAFSPERAHQRVEDRPSPRGNLEVEIGQVRYECHSGGHAGASTSRARGVSVTLRSGRLGVWQSLGSSTVTVR